MGLVTVTREHVREAVGMLNSNRFRAGLVILGVAMAVTTLMAVVAVVIGLTRKISADVRSSDNVVIRLAKVGIVVDGDREIFRRPNITVQEWRAIRGELDSVWLADFIAADDQNRMVRVHHRDKKSAGSQVFGTSWEFPMVYAIPLVAGRYLTEEDVLHGRRVCVLGFGPLTDVFPRVDPVGKKVRIGTREYTVIGAFAERDSLFGRMADNFVAVPFTTFEKDFARRDHLFTAIDMVPVAGVDAEQLSDEVRTLLRARRKLRPGDEDNFELLSQDQVQQFLESVTGPAGAVMVALASIGLMVGGIGVMAIMLVSVTQRTMEVGVRMALGARRRDVLWQFLTEAALLTGLGGAVGVLGGRLAAAAVEVAFGIPVQTPLGWTIGAVLLSAVIGIVSGLYPAWRAAHLDPVDAMRAD